MAFISYSKAKEPEAAHHKFQDASWEKIESGTSVRSTKLEKVDLIIKERRLRWFCHLLRMDDDEPPRQARCWNLHTKQSTNLELRKTGTTLYTKT